MRERLSSWLAGNRGRRCKLLPPSSPQDATFWAGEAGWVTATLAAGKWQDLQYLRAASPAPSPIATFHLQVAHSRGLSPPWNGTVQRILDDVKGTPRIRLDIGPLDAAGIHLVSVRLGDRLIEGSPLRVRVRPCMPSLAATSSLHPVSSADLATFLPPDVPLPPLPTMELRAGDEGRVLVAARDRYGNLRDEGADQLYAVLKRVDGPEDAHGVAAYMQPPAAAQSRGRADVVGVSDLADGSYSVHFIRGEAAEYELSVWLEGKQVRGVLPVHIRAGPMCMLRCMPVGSGIHAAVAGTTASFRIVSRDICGNLVRHSSESGSWCLRFEPRGDVDPHSPRGVELAASAAEAQAEARLGYKEAGGVGSADKLGPAHPCASPRWAP